MADSMRAIWASIWAMPCGVTRLGPSSTMRSGGGADSAVSLTKERDMPRGGQIGRVFAPTRSGCDSPFPLWPVLYTLGQNRRNWMRYWLCAAMLVAGTMTAAAQQGVSGSTNGYTAGQRAQAEAAARAAGYTPTQ